MDVSATVGIILEEFESCETPILSICFQNHLYGCLSVIEQQTEEEEILLDLSVTDWTLLGQEYGFLEDGKSVYSGSESYRSLLTDLLTRIVPQTDLDLLEETLFALLRETNATYFQAALVSAELEPGLLAEASAILNQPLMDSKIKTANVDPVKKKRGLSHTRSTKVKAVALTVPKGLAKTRRRKGIIA